MITMMDHVLQEIQQLVAGALARHGTAGRVEVSAEAVTLIGNGPNVSAPIQHVIARWEQMPFDERQRQCATLARSLARKRHPDPPKPPRQATAPVGVLVAAALAIGGGAYYFKVTRDIVARPAENKASSAAAPRAFDAESERAERAHRVCNATRTRLARGATVGPTDAEGWVVELSLVRSDRAGAFPSLEPLVQGSYDDASIVWDGFTAPELKDTMSRVKVLDQQWPPELPQYRERSLTLSGQHVLTYFRERERIKLVRFAHALAEQQGAMMGALYARCSEGEARHMGSWFLGTSPGTAAASLLYFMGAHADPPHLQPAVLSSRAEVALEPAFALSTLLDKTKPLKKQDVAQLIGAQDGMVAGLPQFTTLSFPFVDSDRALRASSAIAGRLDAPPFVVKARVVAQKP